LLKGPGGNGKSTLNEIISKASEYKTVTPDDIFTDNNRDILEGATLAFLDEVHTEHCYDKLKRLVDQEFIDINQKYAPRRFSRNRVRYIITSNHDLPFKTDSIWRLAVYQCNKTMSKDFHNKLMLIDGGEIRQYLLDYAKTNPVEYIANTPDNEAKEFIKRLSTNPIDSFIEDYKDTIVEGETTTTELYYIFKNEYPTSKLTMRGFSIMFCDKGGYTTVRTMIDGIRQYRLVKRYVI